MSVKRLWPYLAAAGVLTLADQVLKLLARANKELLVSGGGFRIPGFFALTFVENTGASYGFLRNVPNIHWFFVAVAILACAGIVWALKKDVFPIVPARWAMAAVMGGALGNALDRIFFDGHVADYAKFTFAGPGPLNFIFNFADVCVVCGGVALILSTLLAKPKKEAAEAVPSAESALEPEEDSGGNAQE